MTGIDVEGAILAAAGSNGVKVRTAIDGLLKVHESIDALGGFFTALRLAHMIGQCAHESAAFTRTHENLNYTTAARIKAVFGQGRIGRRRFPNVSDAEPYVRQPEALANKVYDGRQDLGNTRTGDGWRYRGRGWLQITGRRNYRVAGKALGIDLESIPSAAAQPATAWRIATHYLGSRKRKGRTAFQWADDDDVEMVTRIVSGGKAGLVDRTRRTMKALLMLERTWPE